MAWFACVLTAAAGWPWTGTLVALLLTALHLCRSAHRRGDLILVAVAGVFGTVADSLLFRAGWLDFTSGVLVAGISPHWMIALWINFATLPNHCLRWLQHRLLLAAAMGAVAGPFAYYAGVRLGALRIQELPTALPAIAIVWAIALPLLLGTARRWRTSA